MANEEEEVEEESTPKQKQKSVKLREIGPRLDLRLVKIEEGVVQGKVLYHAFVKK